MPEHKLPDLVHAHHMAPRVAPGHGVDSSAEERRGDTGLREASGARPAGWDPLLITWPGQFEAL